jgi:hypothetical protein
MRGWTAFAVVLASTTFGGVVALALRSPRPLVASTVTTTITKTVESSLEAESEAHLDRKVAEAASARLTVCHDDRISISECGIYRLVPNPRRHVICGADGWCVQEENGVKVPVYTVTPGRPCSPEAQAEIWEATDRYDSELACMPAE